MLFTMRKILVIFIVVLSAGVFVSCSRSPEKKLAGTWKVEDVTFESNRQLDPAQIESSKEIAKSVSYELLEDKTAKIHAGTTVLDGSWTYKEAEKGVYMAFSGSLDTVLLGRLEEGKLINEANRSGIRIITIFIKEN